MNKDEAFKEYEETMDMLVEEFNIAKERAKAILDELKAVRDLQQKKGEVRKCRMKE